MAEDPAPPAIYPVALTLRLTANQRARLEIAARHDGATISDCIRRALVEWLDSRGIRRVHPDPRQFPLDLPESDPDSVDTVTPAVDPAPRKGGHRA